MSSQKAGSAAEPSSSQYITTCIADVANYVNRKIRNFAIVSRKDKIRFFRYYEAH